MPPCSRPCRVLELWGEWKWTGITALNVECVTWLHTREPRWSEVKPLSSGHKGKRLLTKWLIWHRREIYDWSKTEPADTPGCFRAAYVGCLPRATSYLLELGVLSGTTTSRATRGCFPPFRLCLFEMQLFRLPRGKFPGSWEIQYIQLWVNRLDSRGERSVGLEVYVCLSNVCFLHWAVSSEDQVLSFCSSLFSCVCLKFWHIQGP